MSITQPSNPTGPLVGGAAGAGTAGTLALTSGPLWWQIAGMVLIGFAMIMGGALLVRLGRKGQRAVAAGAHSRPTGGAHRRTRS